MKRRSAVAILIIALFAGAGISAAYAFLAPPAYPCGPQSPIQKSNVTPVQFGAVTEFTLPANRSPNAITTAPDGSVWFAELGVPGVAHLYPTNGTLVEYRWPYVYPSTADTSECSDWSDTWGVALWNGMVWGSNADTDSLVGLNTRNDSFQSIQLKTGAFPYTMAVGPDNYLWFTQLSFPAQIGKVDPVSHQVTYYQIPAGGNSSSAYLLFQSSTLAYALTIFPYTGGGNVFSFDPTATNVTFTLVGGSNVPGSGSSSALASFGNGPSTPTGLAVGEGGIWLTEHSESDMALYNTTSMQWRLFPTSTVPYIPLTLPYFDVSNGTTVWFNEHYGNKLAEICCNASSLTEYSFSNPPAANPNDIDNALTIAMGEGRVWFTGWTGDFVGYVSTSYEPTFSVSLQGNSSVSVQPGASAQVAVELSGQSTAPLSVQFSDSETFSGTPQNLTFSASQSSFNSLSGEQGVTVTVAAAAMIAPGQYNSLITVSDGLVLRSVYLTVVVP